MTDQEALELVESIVADYFCADLDMRAMDETFTHDLDIAYCKLSLIYRITHSLVQSHTCFHAHRDWRAEAEALLKLGMVND